MKIMRATPYLIAVLCVLSSCSTGLVFSNAQSETHVEAAHHFAPEWMDLMLNRTKYNVINPPVAARAYPYGAITLYESRALGAGKPGLSTTIPDFPELPSINDTKIYD